MKGTFTRSMYGTRILLSLCFSAVAAFSANAQVKLSNGSPSAVIDYSNSMQTSVGTNPSTAFAGSGFSPNPVAAGLLNSNAWAMTGMSDGAIAFGGTGTTGDHARGSVAAPVATGGVYAYTGAPQSVANPCIMLQPGGSDWNSNGTLTLRVENTGTTNITQLVLSYNIYVRNDQGRASSFNFSHSADNTTYTTVPALNYTSIEALDALGWVLVGSAPSRSTTIMGLNIAPGGFYYVRWTGNDVSGAGSRDEFGLDDVNVAATFAPPSCSLISAGLTDVHCENNNESNSQSDDYIWFQLNPTGSGLGTGYNVTVNVGSVLLNGSNPATNVPYGSSNFFRLQAGSAGGGNVIVTITDATSGASCTIQVTIVDPGSCSQGSCSVTGSGLSSVACNNNGTIPNPADDYISFFLNPTGINISTYSLTVSVGTVTLIGGGPATNVSYGAPTQFRLQNGSAGGGNVILFITDDNDPDCVLAVIILDTGSCSAPLCTLSVTCPPQPIGVFNCNNPVPAAVTTEAGFEALGGIIGDTPCGTIVITSTTTAINNCSSTSVTRVYTIFDDLSPANGIRDANEAFFTCTLVYTYAPDQTPPSLTCPGPVSVSCSFQVPAQNIALVTGVSDNCSGTPIVSFVSDANSSQTCANRYTVTRTYKATDICGNMQTCTQIITVNDQTAPTFNQNPLPGNTTIACTAPLPIAPMLTGSDACGGIGSVPDVIWINEFHYDNVGADVGEFVEVAGTASLNLTDYQIILYNGNGGVVYTTTPLTGSIDDEGSGFGAVSFSYPANGIQNGAPDGLALYRISTNQVLQFLSYEGVFQATDGPANGMFSTDVGVLELGSEAAGLSLQLTGTGQVSSNFTWVGPIAQSPGTLNAGQTINPLPASIAATFMQTEMAGNCPGSRIVTRTWTLTDACNLMTMHTQTINVTDTDPPVLTPMPPNVTIACDAPVPPQPAVVATDACDPAGIINGPVWINELHYDNVGNDVNEFVEIAGRAGTNLAGYDLFFYNGSTGMMGGTYDNLALSGIIPNQSNGFGTIAFFISGIQNGPSDGIAFVKGGTVVQFLSYEGVMTAIGGPANGMVSTDIGVAEAGTEAPGQSLRLSGNGATYAAFVWNGPSVAFPATPGQVNQGQTFPVQPPIGLLVTFTETSMTGSCAQNRSIKRTWSATDACGNTTTYTQTISVGDNTGPTIVCQNATVNLDIFGNVLVTQAQLLQSVSDNCAPAGSIVVTPPGPFSFNCAQEGTTQPVVLTATDPCGNTASCTAFVTINPFPRCTPKILITDPCVCKNNATNLINGQFNETIKIEGLAGQTWTIISATGLYLSTSSAPPNSPAAIPPGTTFTQTPNNSGDYFFTGIHVDALGYSITVSNGAGFVLTIGNSCVYPNPSITSDLSGAFCLFSDPITLTGDPGDANIVSEGFTVNGVPAIQFNPAQGVGQYTIVYTVNGGVPKAFGPNDPGCIQSVSTIVHVIATPAVVNCNDFVNISLPASCTGEVRPDDVLEGTYGCFDDYLVELDRTLPLGNGPWESALLTSADIGKTYQYRVTHKVSGNTCWGSVKIEDKLPPTMVCQDIHLICPITNYDPGYLQNVLGIATAYPIITDCSNYPYSNTDTWVDLSCTGSINGQNNISAYVLRKWTATDQWGNSTTCNQYIYFDRRHVADVEFPDEFVIQCNATINTSPSVTGAPYLIAFGREWPLHPSAGFCELQAAYSDQILPVCDGTYKIIRTWTVLDWCLPTTPVPPFTNPTYYIQVIKVADETGPAFTCPPNTTVSIDPFACCATVDLPDRIITDACSRVNNISGTVVTFDPFTGDQTGILTFGGVLTDFPGNNWWNRDTMGQWGTTPCLPIGTHTVTYRAQDDCSNIRTCTFRLAVQDLIPPVAACDQLTKVALGSDGEAIINASTFDDGSYDQCCLKDFKAGKGGGVGPTVSFDCGDIGDTLMVTFRVTDCNGNTNDCMVQVLVEDKIKPVCQSPNNVTVSCEQFDPSLWVYGKADILDNCCLDETKVYQGVEGLTHAVNYANFDTLCNKGTIVRTFRAFDCYGNSSQCTQRIVVTYEQDYFVRFPNDVIVTICDGTGVYGEPTFFGKDCELLGVSYEDEIFTVVPDACFKIERNWKIINWCTYNPNAGCINVPNPNPNAITNHPTNLPGPIVSPIQTVGDPWKSTIVRINPTDALTTNYSIFYDPNANCYTYKQIIKVIDTQDPIVDCPASPVTICDLTPNDPQLWNAMYWWDNTNQSHDLCEAPSDICITATDLCSGANLNIEYQLFLDLDGDGIMETVVNSTQLGNQQGGLGWNNIQFGNFTGVGVSRQFDGRPVPTNQKWGFAIQETVSGLNKSACVKFNTFQAQNTFVTPQLPHGTHKIKWFVTDGCGNETICEYTIIIKDCKAPTVVCLNGLSVNIMPTGMITLWASDFLQYAEDNCTQTQWLKYGIRKCGTGTGFPVDAQGNPITNVTFDCTELGTQCVELWALDLAGNADFCETYVIVQDNAGSCGANGTIAVSGALKTEMTDGVAEGNVNVTGSVNFAPPFSYFGLSNNQGVYGISNSVPAASSLTISPVKDDNPLNGVTTYDLVLISKHILGIEPLGTPYKMIAADANKSNSITTFDIVELRKLILGIHQELPANTSWRFVDKTFTFQNPANPFQAAFPENISVGQAMSNQMDEDFVGVKIGDVNNTAVANSLMVSDDRTVGTLLFDLNDRAVAAGEEFDVTFKAADKTQGYQMTLNLNGLEVSEIVGSENVSANNFGVFADALTVSVDNADAFTVKFRAAKAGKLSEMLAVSSRITKSEAYSLADGRLEVALRFDGKTIAGVGFELYQNQPNPFVNKTFVGFHLPEAATATLTIYDETGRLVFTQKGDFAKGYNSISLDRALLNTTGVLYYTLETATDAATKKMIQAK